MSLLTLFDTPSLIQQIRASLFSNSEQGALYDLYDRSTLFQDAAGTTPWTAYGQPLGLQLDKSKGLVLGSERVTNGSFASGTTSWTNNGGIATTFAVADHDGKTAALHVVSPALGGGAVQAAVFEVNKVYTVTYDVKVISGSMYFGIGGNEIGGVRTTVNSGSWTTVTDTVYGSLSNTNMRAYSVAAAEFWVDNISVKEVTGNHRYQTTSASRPTTQQTYLSLDKIDDHMLVASGGAGTTGFLLGAGIVAPAAGAARTLWSDRGTNTGYKVGIDASNQIFLSVGNGVGFTTLTGPALTAGTKYSIIAWHDGANLNLSVNGTAATPVAHGAVTAGTSTITIGKANGSTTEFWGDRIYGMVYRKNDASSAYQRALVNSYIISSMGGLT